MLFQKLLFVFDHQKRGIGIRQMFQGHLRQGCVCFGCIIILDAVHPGADGIGCGYGKIYRVGTAAADGIVSLGGGLDDGIDAAAIEALTAR